MHQCRQCAQQSAPSSSSAPTGLGALVGRVEKETSERLPNTPIDAQPCKKSLVEQATELLRQVEGYRANVVRLGKARLEKRFPRRSYERLIARLATDDLRYALKYYGDGPNPHTRETLRDAMRTLRAEVKALKLPEPEDMFEELDAPGLWVGGRKWEKSDLTDFVAKIALAGYLKADDRDKHIDKLVHFMTENEFARFEFEDESQLKSDLISQYIDERMAGSSSFQRLTHDKRGALFIAQHFKPNARLQQGDQSVQAVPPRTRKDLRDWQATFQTILPLLNEPPPLHMQARPDGHLWIFRTMNRAPAEHLVSNFHALRAAAVQAAREVADGRDAQHILDQHFTHEDFSASLHGHFGDLFQALTYNAEARGSTRNVLVGFKIATGAELIMYSPLVMVFAGHHVDLTKSEIAGAMARVFGRVNEGEGRDGIVKGYLSVKHELRGDFSFGLASDPMSLVLFFLLVADIKPYGSFGVA